jgi:lipopolysaccharide export system permease protein
MTDLRNRYEQRSDLSRVAPGVFQTSRDGSRVFFVERSGDEGGVGRNVFILTNGGGKESVTTARSGHLETEGENRVLVLDRGQRNDFDTKNGSKGLASFDSYRVVAWERVVRGAQEQPPKARQTFELLRDPNLKSQGELSWRFGLLLGAGNLVLLGVGLSATNPRRASNWNLMFALLGFVIYYNLINLSQAWVGSGRLSLAAALFGLHGGVFALALALIWWRDQQGTSARRWKPRQKAAA